MDYVTLLVNKYGKRDPIAEQIVRKAVVGYFGKNKQPISFSVQNSRNNTPDVSSRQNHYMSTTQKNPCNSSMDLNPQEKLTKYDLFGDVITKQSLWRERDEQVRWQKITQWQPSAQWKIDEIKMKCLQDKVNEQKLKIQQQSIELKQNQRFKLERDKLLSSKLAFIEFTKQQSENKRKTSQNIRKSEMFYRKQAQVMAEQSQKDLLQEQLNRKNKLKLQYQMLEQQRKSDYQINHN